MPHLNSSIEIKQLCEHIVNVRVIMSMILSPINLIGSILVLKAIQSTSELKKISTFQFIANLTVADIMLSITSLPLLLTMKYSSGMTAREMKHVHAACKFFFDAKRMVSVFTLVGLSFDKVLACIFHLKYNNLVTSFRTCLFLAVVWIISIGASMTNWVTLKEIYSGGTCESFRAMLDVSGAIIVFICFLVILGSNLYLMVLSRGHQKQDRDQRREASSRIRKIYDSYKSLKSLALLLCMFGIGLLPVILYFIIQQIIGCDTYSCTAVWEYLNIIHFLDLNTRFIIYCCRFKSLYRSVLKIMHCDSFRRTRVAPEVINKKKENGNVTMVDEMPGGRIKTIE